MSLQQINLPESLQELKYQSLTHTSIKNIHFPKNVQYIHGESIIGLEDLSIDPENPYLEDRDNCHGIVERETNIMVKGCNKTTIPNSVVEIATDCFLYCEGLTNIIIPISVQKMNHRSFAATGLVGMSLPEGMTEIPTELFNKCHNLQTVTIPSTVATVATNAFDETNLYRIYCYAINPPEFDPEWLTDLSNVTLFCPASSVDLYRNAHGWNQCKSFQPIDALDEYILTDSDNYTQTVDFETKKFEYSRIYKNTNWQTIILPVSLDYEDFCNDFEIAKIYNIIVTQSVEGGDLGDASIQIVKLKEGDYTVPNVPYMIKAKVADSENAQALSKENCVVYRANPQSLECSNTETAFTFTGTYSAISAADLAGYYAMSGGTWYHQTGTAGLKPMRAYMSITSKTGGYNSIVANHAPLRVSVVGEEEAGEVSAIITVAADTNAEEGIIIDRLMIGLPVGSYNLRGKKVIVK